MKNYLFLAMIALGTLACNNEEPQDELSALAGSQCTYADRRTTSTLISRKGTVRVTVNPTENWVDIYLTDDPNTPYCPCNLPQSFSRDGIQVEFSAEVKETLANERWRCQPIVLTAIRKSTAE